MTFPEIELDGPRDVDSVRVAGVPITAGTRVVLSPQGRTDVQDMFVAGKPATVRAIRQDVDGTYFVAVTIDGDPAADLFHEREQYRHFTTDEVRPLDVGESA
ncbi:hypothetical protein [Haloechinothrix salitolerans]|uniref:Uncharacterized protein n=1 Tax=Haloechinothrix salitolerans TaxID=926830 RepID=A0ABW2C293_9PSEU